MNKSCYFFFFQAEDGIRDSLCDWSSDVCSSDLGSRIGDQEKDFIRGLGLTFAVPMREPTWNRHVRFSGRSEERRVGKECRSRWSSEHQKKKRRYAGVR